MSPLGLLPLLQPLDEPFTPASACGGCHPQELVDWAGSRHRSSWTNALFFEGFVDETLTFCVTCHAPLASQTAEVMANAKFYASRDPRQDTPPTAFLPEPTAEEGVTCGVCHVRDGQIVTSAPTPGHPRARVEPALADGSLCAPCHEFPFASVGPEGTSFTDDLMQSTVTEWRAWQASTGRTEGCVDCHLPGGRHLFRGAHDVDFLRGSLSVEEVDGALILRSVDVGHALPTGDLFRNVTVEAGDGDGWRVVARLGRTFRTTYDASGVPTKGSDADHRIFPGEPRRVPIPDGPWRIVYRYGSDADEARGRLTEDELLVVLVAGRAPPARR